MKHPKHDKRTSDQTVEEEHRFSEPDASSADRDPTAGQYNCTGTIVTGRHRPRKLAFESMLEHDVAITLNARPDVSELREQVALPYVDADGNARVHYLDFLVTKTDGTTVAVSVKPHDRAAKARALLRAALRRNASFADRFLVMTDRHLDRDAVDNAAQVAEARRREDPELDALVDLMAGSLIGSTTIASLVEASGHGSDMYQAVVRALGDGTLVRTSGKRIGYSSVVGRAAQ